MGTGCQIWDAATVSDREIQKAVDAYLEARSRLLDLGHRYPERIGGNDNLIGRIGEFLALRFLEAQGRRPTKIEHASNPGYDLVDGDTKIQVKVITAENKLGRNVRLRPPWDELLLIQLDENYQAVRIGSLSRERHERARIDHPKWSATPYVKLTMLGEKGLIGRYGRVYGTDELSSLLET